MHFLFNMATGSGKTLIMAGLILYLYEQGYRNFLFFVNSTNIIEKTKDNFLNPASIKYLFGQEMTIGNRRVRVDPVQNFEGVNQNEINICFTTIQQLHIDLTTQKENAITFEDFRKYKIVLIADEAHHMSATTQEQAEVFRPTWENTVQTIFEKNTGNLLLEFTATHDYTNFAMVSKYRNKVICRYDLPEFRNDRFSKDVTLVYSDFDLNERILQALILSQYKQEVAAKYRINLKPVLLFKAQKFIAQSQKNKANFHKIIEKLNAKQISKIRKSDIAIVQRAFRFFEENKINDEQLKAAMGEILKLNPKPGETGSISGKTQYIVPDFTIMNDDGVLKVRLNGRNAPELRLSASYIETLKAYENSPHKEKQLRDAVQYIKQKVDGARWFIDSVKQRQNTLMKTMQAIVQRQHEFFIESGDETKLKPMILKDIATQVELDISTISRVANSKYVETDFGIIPLKFFFSEGLTNDDGEEVSNREIKKILSNAIGQEDKVKPLTDEALMDLLKEKGYNIARRTVAKYREQLGIPVARLRKEL